MLGGGVRGYKCQLSLEKRRCELAQNKETEPGGRGGQGHMLFEYLKHGHTLLQQGQQQNLYLLYGHISSKPIQDCIWSGTCVHKFPLTPNSDAFFLEITTRFTWCTSSEALAFCRKFLIPTLHSANTHYSVRCTAKLKAIQDPSKI